MKTLIIGKGKISTYLKTRLEEMGISVCRFHYSDGAYKTYLKKMKPNAVFLAISTKDKGEAAARYITVTAESRIPIITCEKGSFSYHAHDLIQHLNLIGYSAAAGGGTRLIKYALLRNLNGQPADIHAVLNGTLNFIFDKLQQGDTLAEACFQARSLGYAEPGETDPLALINGELKDVTMKICVFHNIVLSRDKIITPEQLNTPQLGHKHLQELSGAERPYRLIVSFSNHHSSFEDKRIGSCIDVSLRSGWNVHASFREISQSSKQHSWLPSGAGNAVQIIEGELGIDGKYCVNGPGAGLAPTTKAMMDDFYDLTQSV